VSRGRAIGGAVVTLVALLVVFVLLVIGTRSIKGLGYEPAAVRSTTGHNITLETFPDSYACHGENGGPGGGPHPEWVTYCPSTSIQVPAYSTITVTIKQYDSGGSVHNPFFAHVKGTVGNVMLVNGRPTTSVNWEDIAHTFTIQTPPNLKQTQLFVNVPLPGVSESAPENVTIAGHKYQTPNIIVFKFKTGAPGSYVWHCYVPCGEGLSGEGLGGQDGFGGPMATTGYMSGTLTVG
jgi:hypothetical protein